MIKRAKGTLLQVRAVWRDGTDVPTAIAIRLKRDALSIGGPRGLADVAQFIGNLPGLTSACGQHPQTSQQIDGQRSPIRRQRGGHGGAFAQREIDMPGRTRLRKPCGGCRWDQKDAEKRELASNRECHSADDCTPKWTRSI